MAWSSYTWHGAATHGMVQLHMAWSSYTWHGAATHGMVQLHMAWSSYTWHGAATKVFNFRILQMHHTYYAHEQVRVYLCTFSHVSCACVYSMCLYVGHEYKYII